MERNEIRIPKYIKEILERAQFSYEKDRIPGYTIKIEKKTPYTLATTLRDEAKKLVEWANREYKRISNDETEIATLNGYDWKTSYKYKQYATVTIYDPIMRKIEKYIKEETK